MQPVRISYNEATAQFESGNVIYIQTEGVESAILPETSVNTIMLRDNCKDASFNMYMGNCKPIEIGLPAIICWIKERSQNELAFFTRYSKDFWTIN